MPRRPSLLSDDLLRRLMAAGQTDVIIGFPTLNNAATIEPVLAAVHQAVAHGLPRQRVLIINSDGGSDDGTQMLVSQAAGSRAATLLASHSLRTMHRIAAPYHGLPGKRAAIRTLFAAADLLQVRAVAVIDPTAPDPSAELFRALLSHVVDSPVDFVAPCPVRDPRERPLVTQVVLPMIAGAFGASFEDPIGDEFAVSGRFVADVLRQPAWDDEPLRAGIDIWLRVHALAGGFRAVQVRTPPRLRSATPAQPPLRTVVQQVLLAVWTCLDLDAPRWLADAAAVTPETVVLADGPPPARPNWDLDEMDQAFGAAVRDLEPVWRGFLPAALLRQVRSAAELDAPELPDSLWADLLVEFAAAWKARRVRADDLTASFAPLYLGRAASFLRESQDLDADDARLRLDTLVRHVQERRHRLVDAWQETGPGGS
jgi:hypothetical protein